MCLSSPYRPSLDFPRGDERPADNSPPLQERRDHPISGNASRSLQQRKDRSGHSLPAHSAPTPLEKPRPATTSHTTEEQPRRYRCRDWWDLTKLPTSKSGWRRHCHLESTL